MVYNNIIMIDVCVFSATGNTLTVCNLIKEQLEKTSAVNIFNINNGCEKFELLGNTLLLGYPVHGFNAPKNFLTFIKNLPDGKGKPVYLIKTSGEPSNFNNSSSKVSFRLLKKRHYDVMGEFQFVMPYNLVFRHSDEMASLMLYTAKKMAIEDSEKILNGEKNFIKKTFGSTIMSFICKCEHWGMNLNGRFFHVKKNKCINCKLCEKNCPENNIKIVGDKKFKFKGKCLGCARCSFNCPTDAIRIGLFNFLRVNGKYNFNADYKKAKIGKYCRKSYIRYFKENLGEEFFALEKTLTGRKNG